VLTATLASCLLFSGCNDLTDLLPGIAGTYTYQSRSSDFVSLTRNGVVTIDDFDRRTASFTGTFDFTDDAGRHVTGSLLGAFVTRDHVYFRFLNSRFEFHEGATSWSCERRDLCAGHRVRIDWIHVHADSQVISGSAC
jgi:hypothetical protein